MMIEQIQQHELERQYRLDAKSAMAGGIVQTGADGRLFRIKSKRAVQLAEDLFVQAALSGQPEVQKLSAKDAREFSAKVKGSVFLAAMVVNELGAVCAYSFDAPDHVGMLLAQSTMHRRFCARAFPDHAHHFEGPLT